MNISEGLYLFIGLFLGYFFSFLFYDIYSFTQLYYINFFYKKTLYNIDDSLTEKKQVQIFDIDRNNHMNNSRYLYYLNFSRRKLLNSLGIWKVLLNFQFNAVIQSQMIRYRKELKCYDNYSITSKILCWVDTDSSFIIESRFIDSTDFICAIYHCKYKIISNKSNKDIITKMKPSFILKEAGLIDEKTIVEIPNYIDSWLESINLSSKSLNPMKSQ